MESGFRPISRQGVRRFLSSRQPVDAAARRFEGLALLVRRYIMEHGGKVWIEDRPQVKRFSASSCR